MQEILSEVLGELASLVLSVLGTGVFMTIGFFGEQAGLAQVMAGDPALGAWELFVGTWALFVGLYLLGYKQAVPRLQRLAQRASG